MYVLDFLLVTLTHHSKLISIIILILPMLKDIRKQYDTDNEYVQVQVRLRVECLTNHEQFTIITSLNGIELN